MITFAPKAAIMKKILTGLLIVLCLIGCKSEDLKNDLIGTWQGTWVSNTETFEVTVKFTETNLHCYSTSQTTGEVTNHIKGSYTMESKSWIWYYTEQGETGRVPYSVNGNSLDFDTYKNLQKK